MKKCNDCNVEMIDNCIIEGQHPFELGVDGASEISIHIPTDEKGSFLGFKYDKVKEIKLKARICPKCGKIELYINPEDMK
ncbi:MAG: hypothetical protein IJ565_01145 [Bacilli bacterium]|nr:hypothetical protein [Bacilli bacterium]